ncbi:MAG TPA: hypothetical protein VG328_05090 [Stellaceae bacterium]|jgi:putative methyltransferase (TIGR04325 family)|nr:hypothetical protein [Stellaceae bacterium]
MGIISALRRRISDDKTSVSASSWKDACEAADSYGAEIINKFRLDRSLGRQSDGSLLKNSVLGLVMSLLNKANPLVTDFGGGTGDLGVDLRAVYPLATYTVVENPTMVELVGNELRGILFSNTIPPVCDIFFSSSTLQYLEDPEYLLKRGISTAHHAVVLVRNCFSDRVRFGVQKSALFDNGIGPIPPGWQNRQISYPHRTLIEKEVISTVESHGFTCVANLEEHSGAAMPGTYGRQLVFWRNSNKRASEPAK